MLTKFSPRKIWDAQKLVFVIYHSLTSHYPRIGLLLIIKLIKLTN